MATEGSKQQLDEEQLNKKDRVDEVDDTVFVQLEGASVEVILGVCKGG